MTVQRGQFIEVRGRPWLVEAGDRDRTWIERKEAEARDIHWLLRSRGERPCGPLASALRNSRRLMLHHQAQKTFVMAPRPASPRRAALERTAPLLLQDPSTLTPSYILL